MFQPTRHSFDTRSPRDEAGPWLRATSAEPGDDEEEEDEEDEEDEDEDEDDEEDGDDEEEGDEG